MDWVICAALRIPCVFVLRYVWAALQSIFTSSFGSQFFSPLFVGCLFVRSLISFGCAMLFCFRSLIFTAILSLCCMFCHVLLSSMDLAREMVPHKWHKTKIPTEQCKWVIFCRYFFISTSWLYLRRRLHTRMHAVENNNE